MSPHIAADDDMAKTFIATFRVAGPLRDIVHPDPRSIKIGKIVILMYSVLSTWGQFPYTLSPSSAGRLWVEFMTAYRRKRRPLTHNPVSLIGKGPCIVSMRLEQGRFRDDGRTTAA